MAMNIGDRVNVVLNTWSGTKTVPATVVDPSPWDGEVYVRLDKVDDRFGYHIHVPLSDVTMILHHGQTTLTLDYRDWRLIQRAVEHYGHHLVRRAARPSAKADGADQRNLDRLRALAAPLSKASGEEGGFT